jgi:predicted house-cleaning noncanonical NTP pyrophosphatase (MazG superfamily)
MSHQDVVLASNEEIEQYIEDHNLGEFEAELYRDMHSTQRRDYNDLLRRRELAELNEAMKKDYREEQAALNSPLNGLPYALP